MHPNFLLLSAASNANLKQAFAAAQRSDEDRQAYIFASRRASSVIVKPKLGNGRQHAHLSPKSVNSLPCSVAGFFFHS